MWRFEGRLRGSNEMSSRMEKKKEIAHRLRGKGGIGRKKRGIERKKEKK